MNIDLSPLIISLKTSLVAVFFTFILGIVAARCMLHASGKVQWILDVIFTFPLVLPPTVVGYILLVFFGKNSFIGNLLSKINISIIFTWEATVISAIIVSFPLMYRAAKGAFDQIDMNLIWAARTLGLSELKIFIKIMIPLALPGIISGAILAFARALGEFGATLMIAGNIPKVTQTIPIAIYFANASGKTEVASFWTVIIIGISLVVLGFMNYLGFKEKRSISGGTTK
ncbi:molybdate ABC transporter permease subunit [Alkaliphilus oremlandii]|uniref:Molybdenum transport system permease n=1 Tax=Alkaliphilus oremlandii (strain OhILAs) TaxID=350688 RepID=A8MJ34_ALKOO|nr:molybdate ABC transporter permease subunit [Alkaliphilus oremlandii]ABW19816.1 molybdate ABC transporter, inner membrane subunit [Alkaliphilus oremlandii OhILAs]